MRIEETLFQKSMNIVPEIYSHSDRLRGSDVEYNERRDSFLDLVSVEGFTSFHPEVRPNLVHEFKLLFKEHVRRLYEEYYHKHHTCDSKEHESRYKYYIADYIYDHITNEGIINNQVPAYALKMAKDEKLKGFNSPRLSKYLVQLCGESSKMVAWYTNKCPKKIEKGLDTEYKVWLSVLPHHVAGMSYYSSYNHGGEKWNGQNGTSCQDTLRNGDGSTMYNLLSSMKEETLAVAYLSYTDNDDIWNPIYEARALIRVVELENGKKAYLVCRTFGRKETNYILCEGLRNKFDNVLVLEDVRRTYKHRDGSVKTRMAIKDVSTEIPPIMCPTCGGTGSDDDGDDCYRCDGEGEFNGDTYLPYIDDTDYIMFDDGGTTIRYYLPKKALIDKGLYEETEEDKPKSPFDSFTLAC